MPDREQLSGISTQRPTAAFAFSIIAALGELILAVIFQSYFISASGALLLAAALMLHRQGSSVRLWGTVIFALGVLPLLFVAALTGPNLASPSSLSLLALLSLIGAPWILAIVGGLAALIWRPAVLPRKRPYIAAGVVIIGLVVGIGVPVITAGFVFCVGCDGFTSSAQIGAYVTTCTGASGAASPDCIVTLLNTGAASASVVGCSLNLNGMTVVGTLSGRGPLVPDGGQISETCTYPGGTSQVIGSHAMGSFTMNNGATVLFSGVWS